MRFFVRRASAFDEIADEWEQLDLKTSPRLPFTGPLWNRVWWEHFREDRWRVKDTLALYVVRDERGALRGVAPMMLTERPAFGPLRLRVLQFLGADANLTQVRGVVCDPADEAAVTDALIDHLEQCGREWDWLMLAGIRQATDAYRRVGQRVGVEWGREVPDYLLALPADWQTFKTSLGRNIRQSLRKCYNSLARDRLTPTFRVVDHPDQLAPAVDQFLRLHAARASAADTIAHPDVFESIGARTFLRDYLGQAAARGTARIFQLALGGQVVATRIGFVLGASLYLYFSGFDPRWGRYSVMTTTVAEVLKWAIEHKLETVNLSPGNHVASTRWSPTEVMTREAVIPSPSFLGPLVGRAFGKSFSERRARTGRWQP